MGGMHWRRSASHLSGGRDACLARSQILALDPTEHILAIHVGRKS